MSFRNPASMRIHAECREMARNNDFNLTGVMIHVNEINAFEMDAVIMGPPDTPYETGIFELKVKCPDDYPFRPPDVRFITKVWHPNISSATGVICLDILKDKWAASLGINSTLISIRALLADPVPDDPQDAVVANQYLRSREMFNKTAAIWTNVFANGSTNFDPTYEGRIATLTAMGMNKSEAVRHLSLTSWDISKAIESAYD